MKSPCHSDWICEFVQPQHQIQTLLFSLIGHPIIYIYYNLKKINVYENLDHYIIVSYYQIG
jgi:hypothetical protein